jgi:Carboxypeptidase regulatory-like domain
MKRVLRTFTIGLMVSACLAALAFGQAGSTAQISGTVKDASGAILPGVEVTATQIETGGNRSTLSNETGFYVLSNLPVGPYRLEISLTGFRTFVQTGIVLQVNSNPVIDATLQVGQISEQVEVQANAALVETRASGVGQVIENQRILELPLNGRQVTDLITLSGAAVAVENNSTRSMPGGQGIAVGGGLWTGVAYLLDGAMHNNPYDNFNLPLPFPDALQEFKVETSALSAQNGVHSGAAVNAVTKSGTNAFHGDGFWFVRNQIFNATNPFALKRADGMRKQDGLKRNQFGGTIGGPIKANKVFFFGGYQGTTVRQAPPDNITFIPSAKMLAGDFRDFTAPACNGGRTVTLSTPFVNNQINPALFSKAAVNIANKLPKTDDPCGRVTFSSIDQNNNHQAVGKVDYQRNANHSIFGRYIATTDTVPVPFALTGNLLTTIFGGRDNLAQTYTVGETRLINANTVNSVRLAVNRTAIRRVGPDYFNPPGVGVNVFSYLPNFMLVTINNTPWLGQTVQTNATYRTTTYQIAEDLGLVRGTHQLAFGGNLAHWRSNTYANVRANGVFAFNGQTTGLALADFVTGNLFTFQQSNPNFLIMREWYTGWYAQDTWKATPRLTLNYGVRWDPYYPENLTKGTVYNFDLDRFRKGIKSSVFKNAPAGFYYPGDPGFPGQSGLHSRWSDFAPRIGLAWDPAGDGRTSIRAAWGISYDFIDAQYHLNTANAPPWGSDVTITSPAGGFDDPFRGFPGGNPFPLTFDANARFTPFGSFLTQNYDVHRPSQTSWNLTVQRQVATDWLVSASYLGGLTTHTWNTRALNPAVYIPGGSTLQNINQRRRLFLEQPQDGQFIGNLEVHDDGGTATYDGLLTSVQRRVSQGATLSGNYTWSHCIGDPIQTNPPNIGAGFTNPDNRRLDRGNCASDRRHIVNLSAVAEMPRFANDTLRLIASGWRVSGIYRYSSGQFLNVRSGQDRALNGINLVVAPPNTPVTSGGQRLDQILASPYGDKSFDNYLNRAAFQLPALGTFGNMGRLNVAGPGIWTIDMAVSRSLQVREGQRVEFRAEAFNVTNHFQKGNPVADFSSPTFGRILTAGAPRIMQFALKYVF